MAARGRWCWLVATLLASAMVLLWRTLVLQHESYSLPRPSSLIMALSSSSSSSPHEEEGADEAALQHLAATVDGDEQSSSPKQLRPDASQYVNATTTIITFDSPDEEEDEEDEEDDTSSDDEEEEENPFATFLPRSYVRRLAPVQPGYRETFPKPYSGACAVGTPHWKTCNAKPCTRDTKQPRMSFGLPANTTNTGEPTKQYIHRLLRRAWGPDPPMIDLYVRAGCFGAFELNYLFHSLQLFYPTFLGTLNIVLDVYDRKAVEFIVPKAVLAGFNVQVVFEHQPCFRGRIFNQYASLNLYRRTKAEFIVVVDSDVALFRPVTPDVLFNSKGELILATNSLFQQESWHPVVQYFTQIDSRHKFGHVMVTQPITFRVDSFKKFFGYVQAKRGTCYERLLVRFYDRVFPHIYTFCWMCQLGVYIADRELEGYDVHITDKRKADPFLRYAVHVNYERSDKHSYYQTVKASTWQGLCLWFGKRVFADCGKMKKDDMRYIHELTFTYYKFPLNTHSSHDQLYKALATARSRLAKIF